MSAESVAAARAAFEAIVGAIGAGHACPRSGKETLESAGLPVAG